MADDETSLTRKLIQQATAHLQLKEYGKTLPLPGAAKPVFEPRTPDEIAAEAEFQAEWGITTQQATARIRRTQTKPAIAPIKALSDADLVMEMLERGYLVQKIQGGEG